MTTSTSYNGWPASTSAAAIGVNQDWEPIPGHRFPGGIKGGDVEVVMTYVVVQLDARVEPIELYLSGDEWGWFYKMSANDPSKVSCHASATAVDYNAARHPNGRRGTFTSGQVATIRQIQDEVDGVVYWGGDRGTPDEMHFEIQGSAGQVKAVADKLRAAGKPPAPAPTPPPEDPFMALTDAEQLELLRNSRSAKTQVVRRSGGRRIFLGTGNTLVEIAADATDEVVAKFLFSLAQPKVVALPTDMFDALHRL